VRGARPNELATERPSEQRFASRFERALPHAFGALTASGVLRTHPDDFRVDEVLGFKPTGDGEHLWLSVEKVGLNTADVALAIARVVGARVRDVGFAGRKDRYARTRQWFSVYWPGKRAPDWRGLEHAVDGELRVLMTTRSSRKLQVGAHQSNEFAIRLREVAAEAMVGLGQRLTTIQAKGVPNYFGPQRFGRYGNNLTLATRWFEGGEEIRKRALRGLVISAARSWLFNQVLRSRVHSQSWQTCLVGEWSTRNEDGSSVPTGPLFGAGMNRAVGLAGALEAEVAQAYPDWVAGLESLDLNLQRRRLISNPRDLKWRMDPERRTLDLRFRLPAGEFATTILQELLKVDDASLPGARAG
jgi:tRNA pseudouridine13 synthase